MIRGGRRGPSLDLLDRLDESGEVLPVGRDKTMR
jgi:hypothetical protein